ncbi:CheD, stimulates methylation of MCP proteins [Thermosyntropha lipolytica DSM 11003]|uniref:Probable chemoreceptor glutamine deamidase CheD n=1 Tax=Thermosyntropha lipolytica DSM 11003 TaxID=1123382 RepID=A0A1M5KXP6_9FIRM|nr:chemotaxis protein CheD [Thermosyntropha lipolytica]SHG57495.1 CheD, stimulates methylation of MCP proteins [Thermosyntropha lipolytica DSM 11003]
MGKIIQVGMADLKLAKAPDKLMTAGLGSCIGICVRDKSKQLGALAHIMLPLSTQARNADNKAKFADTAIELLVEEMKRNGADITRLEAKFAGGAQMFKFSGESDIMKIGQRNAAAVEEYLQKYGIKILAKDVGGNYGRTITYDPATGDLLVRTIGHGERII